MGELEFQLNWNDLVFPFHHRIGQISCEKKILVFCQDIFWWFVKWDLCVLPRKKLSGVRKDFCHKPPEKIFRIYPKRFLLFSKIFVFCHKRFTDLSEKIILLSNNISVVVQKDFCFLSEKILCFVRIRALIDYWQIDELLLGKCTPHLPLWYNIAPLPSSFDHDWSSLDYQLSMMMIDHDLDDYQHWSSMMISGDNWSKCFQIRVVRSSFTLK